VGRWQLARLAGKAAAGPSLFSGSLGGCDRLVLLEVILSTSASWRRQRKGPPDPVSPQSDLMAAQREVRRCAGGWRWVAATEVTVGIDGTSGGAAQVRVGARGLAAGVVGRWLWLPMAGCGRCVGHKF
jgi:hypothetical protein